MPVDAAISHVEVGDHNATRNAIQLAANNSAPLREIICR